MNDVQASTTEKTATVADQGAHAAPPSTPARKGSTSKKNGPKAPAAAKGGKAKAAAPKKEAKAPKTAAKIGKPSITTAPGQMRPGSKGANVLELISRAKGATLAEIMKATGWQAHSVRGFISGTLGKKMGLSVASKKPQDGDRVYSISK
jgi:hypothetical protein